MNGIVTKFLSAYKQYRQYDMTRGRIWTKRIKCNKVRIHKRQIPILVPFYDNK